MKRWLAYLRLSHMGVVPVLFCLSEEYEFEVGFVYCLGHGLSSCVTFVLFWVLSVVASSRKVFSMKRLFAGSSFIDVSVVSCFCLCCSFPRTVQFFCEVFAVCCSGESTLVLVLLCVYLFLSVLVVLVSLGSLLVRGRAVLPIRGVASGPLSVLMFMGLINFRCFLVF